MDAITCKNCGHTIKQNFCPNCGEKRFNKNQLSFSHFVGEIFEGLTHFDNKFLRTVKTLVAKPGQLSLDYSEGIKVRYMRPIQVFLVVNLIYFFFVTGNIFSLQLQTYLNYKTFFDYNTKEIIKNRLAETSLTLGEYQELFNERVKENSKEFIFVFVPFYAVCFALLFFWKRKKFVEHIVFAAHFVCFMLLFFLLEDYLLTRPFYTITGVEYSENFDNFFQIFTIIIFSVYLFFAFRKFYKASVAWSIIAALAITLSFFFLIQYYRMLLFYKIVYWN
jgi:hypothetical protein